MIFGPIMQAGPGRSRPGAATAPGKQDLSIFGPLEYTVSITDSHSPGAQPATVQITRYPNRRLYDRSQGKYVTLKDIEAVVQRGGNVVVKDSKTGEDFTRSVLTQIILENHPERMELFPVPLFHWMIRS